MATVEEARGTDNFWSVLADGKFHHEVSEGTEGAVRREYETSAGAKGVKYEKLAQSITGKITNIDIYEGDYGKNILVTLDGELTLSLPASSPFGEDVLKKLPNINAEEVVRFAPYSFEDERGKKRKGISITQGDTKVQSFYHEKEGEKWVETNGHPKMPKGWEKFDSDDWKSHFTACRKFMLGEVEKHPLYKKEAPKVKADEIEYPDEEIDPKNIPF